MVKSAHDWQVPCSHKATASDCGNIFWETKITKNCLPKLKDSPIQVAQGYGLRAQIKNLNCPIYSSFAISNAIQYMKGCHHQNLKETSDGDRIHNSTKKTRNPTKSSPEASEVAYDPSPQHTAQRRPSSSMWFYAPPRARIWKYWEGRPIQPLLSMSSGCI